MGPNQRDDRGLVAGAHGVRLEEGKRALDNQRWCLIRLPNRNDAERLQPVPASLGGRYGVVSNSCTLTCVEHAPALSGHLGFASLFALHME